MPAETCSIFLESGISYLFLLDKVAFFLRCVFSDENLGTHRELRVAVCTSTGYLLEIRDRKIVCCLGLPFTDAEQLLSYYHFKTNRLKQYYLAANSQKFVIVKKSENENLVTISLCIPVLY